MQALEIKDNKLEFNGNHEMPQPKETDALIKISLAGICATDLELVKGYAGFSGIPGHEFVGRVEKAANTAWLGKRVVANINLACQTCSICRKEGPEHCPRRTVLGIIGKDGVFAEYVTLPVANLFEVPEGVSDEEAVFTEPLAAALRICEQVHIMPKKKVAVVGPGRLGLLAAQVLRLSGCEVVVFGRSDTSLKLPAEWGFITKRVDQNRGREFDIVVEATGNEKGLSSAFSMVKPRGNIVLKSTYAKKVELDLISAVVDEITLVGSRCGPFEPALRLLKRKEIKVDEMIEAIYPLLKGTEAFQHAARAGARKILLKME